MAGPRHLIPIHSYRRVKVRSRGYLPHWEIEGATYFVTYRPHDSLPRWVVERLKAERRALERQISDRSEVQRAFAMALDRELDSGSGASYLCNDRIAAIVAENLKHFSESRYESCVLRPVS